MEMAKVTSKGQITIPISIRRRLEINEGDKILFINKNEGVMMVNPDVLQSGQVDELTQSEPALNTKSGSKPPPQAAAADEKVADQPLVEEEVLPPSAPDVPAVQEPAEAPQEVRKPLATPPPPKSSGQQAKQIDGLDLGSLLDDIRSIGSNI